MGKRLEGIQWKPSWVSHLGCVQGCLEYLGIAPSMAWLAGGMGHAFALNIWPNGICPSGPLAWRFCERLAECSPDLGFRVSGVCGRTWEMNSAEFDLRQEEAWGFVRAAIDRGIPCYGWELSIPDFYVLDGYDDTGYHYLGIGHEGTAGGTGLKPWRDLGRGIGILEVNSVEPSSPAPNVQIVRQALAFALDIADHHAKWGFDGYVSGLQAFRLWAETLEQGKADPSGNAFNAAVWNDCRGNAVGFLKEAKAKLPGIADALFDEAISHYAGVHEQLSALTDLFPFPPREDAANAERNAQGGKLLRIAAEAEAQGLAALKQILAALG
jgi:hypothetical protein